MRSLNGSDKAARRWRNTLAMGHLRVPRACTRATRRSASARAEAALVTVANRGTRGLTLAGASRRMAPAAANAKPAYRRWRTGSVKRPLRSMLNQLKNAKKNPSADKALGRNRLSQRVGLLHGVVYAFLRQSRSAAWARATPGLHRGDVTSVLWQRGYAHPPTCCGRSASVSALPGNASDPGKPFSIRGRLRQHPLPR